MKKLITLSMVLFVLFLFSANVIAADPEVRVRIYLSEDNLDVGDSFTLTVQLTAEDDVSSSDDIELSVYVRDILVHEDEINENIDNDESYNYTVSSSNFDVSGDRLWRDNLMNYYCGDDQEILVEIGGEVLEASDTEKFDISGEELSFSIDPDAPVLDDKMTVTVLDEEDDEMRGATVKITYLGSNDEWDADDDTWDDTKTDSGGEVEVTLEDEFDDNDFGKYQIDVYDTGYCKETETVDITRTLVVGDPIPNPPQAGKPFKIPVTNQAGKAVPLASVVLSPTGASARTDYQGNATLTVDTPGTYEVIVTAANYDDSDIKTITVVSAPALGISVSPSNPDIGATVTFSVTSSGSAIDSASLTIMLPGGTTKTLTTDSGGKASYVPTVAGIYSIDAHKTGYEASTITFTASNTFSVVVPDLTDRKPGDDITIAVQDKSGNPVVAASVSVVGADVSGTTDASGQYTFSLKSAGEYTLHVTKSGFSTKDQKISLKGMLLMELSSNEVELGNPVTLTVTDRSGSKVSGEFEVIRPDGTTTKISGDTYTPLMAGNHSLTATKSGYSSASQTLVVLPKALDLSMRFEGGTLTIKATSHDEAVSNLTLEIVTPSGEKKEANTDEEGIVMISAEEKGDYAASAKSDVYETWTTTVTKKGLLPFSIWKMFLALFLLVLFVIVALAAVYLGRRRKKRGQMLKVKSNSSLSK